MERGPDDQRASEHQCINDVGFLRSMLDQVQQDFPIDRTRSYVTGFSNGVAMAFRVAAELPGYSSKLRRHAGFGEWIALFLRLRADGLQRPAGRGCRR